MSDVLNPPTRKIVVDGKKKVKNIAPAQLPMDATDIWEIGANYLIRTVTMIDTGRLVAVGPHELVLEEASWIADTGRFMNALATGEFAEVEPFPAGRIVIGRGAIIDAVQIPSLPKQQKPAR